MRHANGAVPVEPADTDEAMRKLLKPVVTKEQVLDVLVTSYSHLAKVPAWRDANNEESRPPPWDVVCQLDSYDDCNWKVAIAEQFYLLKIHNGVESREFLHCCLFENGIVNSNNKDSSSTNHFYHNARSAIHFQNAICTLLHHHHIPTSVPVHSSSSSTSSSSFAGSPVSIHTLPVLSQAHSPARLVVRLFHWIPGQCLSDVGADTMPLEVLVEAGRMLGTIDAALDQLGGPPTSTTTKPNTSPGEPTTLTVDSTSTTTTYTSTADTKELPLQHYDHHHHPWKDANLMVAAERYHQWDGKNTQHLRQFVSCIATVRRRRLVESVLDAFERDLVASNEHSLLRKGIIMGDYNDANILVNENLQVCGVIDFGDSVSSWRVLDVSVAMAYSMLTPYGKANRSFSAAAAMLRGFNSMYQLTDTERKHLVLLIACRLACSVTLGAYSLQQNPDNKYLLLHSEPAWKALELVWGDDIHHRATTLSLLNDVFDRACLHVPLDNGVSPCDDLVTVDPSIPKA